MKFRTACSVLFIAFAPLHSIEQSIPFSFYQLPGYEQSGQDIFSAATNPALLGSVKKTSAAVCSEMRYALKDLLHTSGSIVVPVSFGSFGMHVLHVGNTNFSETAFLVQYARKLSLQKNHIGISFGMLEKRDEGLVVIRQYQADIGLSFSLSENIGYNVVMRLKQLQQTEEDRSMELDYQIGLGYRFTPQFAGAVQICKDVKRDARCYIKGSYQLHPKASVSIACSTATREFWILTFFRLKNMQLGFSVGIHQMMGTTPGCMLMTKE